MNPPENDARSAGQAVSVDFLAAVIEHVAHPIFIKDRAFRLVLVNRAFCEIMGLPREAILGKTDYEYIARSEADFFRKKDEEMFSTGDQVVIDEEPLTDAAGTLHVLSTTKVPLRDASGEVTHLVGIIHDITRLKAAEDALRHANEDLERRVLERTAALQAAQDELVRKERLAVLGQLAGGLAHQIRNPLAAITNAAYVLQRGMVTPSADCEQATAIILAEAWDANRIITDLLDYARVRPPDRRLVSAREIVGRAVAAESFPGNVRVEVHLAELSLLVDPDQVRDALQNLLHNAVEAIPPGGGQITVTARAAGAEAVIVIADTGEGISPDLRGLLFEPLVTTKPLGLGLGLTTTRALIENNGGSISWASESGKGTEFEIRLPMG